MQRERERADSTFRKSRGLLFVRIVCALLLGLVVMATCTVRTAAAGVMAAAGQSVSVSLQLVWNLSVQKFAPSGMYSDNR